LNRNSEEKAPVCHFLNQHPGICEAAVTDFLGLDSDVLQALERHDPSIGRLLKPDTQTAAVGPNIRILNEKELIQRLRAHGVIMSGGKLTSRGLRLSLAWLGVMDTSPPTPPATETDLEPNLPVDPIPGTMAETPAKPEMKRSTLEPEAVAAAPEPEAVIKPAAENPVPKERPHEFTRRPDPPVITISPNDASAKRIFPKPAAPRPAAMDACISRYPTQALDESLVTLLSPQSFEAEHFRMLKTRILYPVSGKPPQSLLITSVNQEDGKSFVAANLAISMAQNLNHPVLLIDCDLRKPSIHRLFGFGDVPGLSEYLSKTATFPSLIQRTDVERLYLLPAGDRPNNPSELLSSARMASLMKELRLRYRDLIVLLDSPPVTVTAEPSVLVKLVSKVLVVVKYGKTRRGELKIMMDKLGRQKLIGGVINCYEHSLREYYEYRKYPGYGKTTDRARSSALAAKSQSH
jgi:capsular exopolysaccharide synthesis family protein